MLYSRTHCMKQHTRAQCNNNRLAFLHPCRESVFVCLRMSEWVCVMGTVSVRGEDIQFVQYKNNYIYGESSQRQWTRRVCVCERERASEWECVCDAWLRYFLWVCDSKHCGVKTLIRASRNQEHHLSNHSTLEIYTHTRLTPKYRPPTTGSCVWEREWERRQRARETHKRERERIDLSHQRKVSEKNYYDVLIIIVWWSGYDRLALHMWHWTIFYFFFFLK